MHLQERGYFAACERAGARGAASNIVNIPLRRGLRDARFVAIFEDQVLPAALLHNPDVLLVQMGCDGLAGDPLGHWNLSTRAFEHAMVKTASTLRVRQALIIGVCRIDW